MRDFLAKIHWANVGALLVIFTGLVALWSYAIAALITALAGL